MRRTVITACIAAIATLLHLAGGAGAQPRPEPPNEISVILKARLYEVDEASHNKVVKARWLSKADLEALEDKPQPADKLFAQLAKQKPVLTGKEANIDPGKSGVLLSAIKPVKHLPTPDQLRLGQKAPQVIDEGFTLGVQVSITADRRYVRIKFQEKGLEIEGVEKETTVDDKGNEVVGEIVCTKESSLSQTRYIPDDGSILLPLRHRTASARKTGRWLIAEVTPRIYIEAEERERRKPAK